jgi:hypothetical protein
MTRRSRKLIIEHESFEFAAYVVDLRAEMEGELFVCATLGRFKLLYFKPLIATHERKIKDSRLNATALCIFERNS